MVLTSTRRRNSASRRSTFRRASWTALACVFAVLNSAARAQAADHSALGGQQAVGATPAGDFSSGVAEAARATSARVIDGGSLETRLLTLANSMRGSGPHAVSSKMGEKVIAMIRMLPKADVDAREVILERLQGLAKDGIPEAVTFLGFAAEEGAFGVARQPQTAAQLYRAASQAGYQPALYDLALMYAYGRGIPRNLQEAKALLERASTAGPEGSNRVCGMGSFIAYRLNDQAAMRSLSEGCSGPLPALAIAATSTATDRGRLVDRLRGSIASGVDDGYVALEVVTRRDAANDTTFSYCLWSLVNRYRSQPTSPAIATSAANCVDAMAAPGSKVASLEPVARQQAAVGLAHLVSAQVQALSAERKGNRFRYGMPVPFLPFTQDDVDLFASAVDAHANR